MFCETKQPKTPMPAESSRNLIHSAREGRPLTLALEVLEIPMVVARTPSLSTRDSQIVDALTRRIRLVSLDQAARVWWSRNRQPLRDARRRLDALSHTGLLLCRKVDVYPMLDLTAPVCSWSPGEDEPEFGGIANRLRSRWPQAAAQRTVVYTATRRLANRIGGFDGRLQHRHQVTHDLHVSELYLRMLVREPKRARAWVGEELSKAGQAYGEKLPDAVLHGDDGRPFQVIEFGGRYSKPRVRDFHQHCATNGLAYELW